MSNHHHFKTRGPDKFTAELVLDGRRFATSRPFYDEQSAILDALMLLLHGHQSVHDWKDQPLRNVELTLRVRGEDGKLRFHSRAVYTHSADSLDEPVCEMKPERGANE